MKNRASGYTLLLAAATILLSTSATAAPFTTTSVSTISPCPSFCGGFGGASDFDSDGGEGALTSFSSLNNVDGNGQAEATFAGVNALPELKAEAFSNAAGGGVRSSRVAATATVMQQYAYTGTGGLTTLSATVDGTITGEGQINSRIVVARAVGGADVPLVTDIGTLVFEVLALTPGLSSLGFDEEVLTATGVSNLSVSFNVNATDSIFIWSQLAVSGIRGGSADSFDTMTLALTGPDGFTPVLGGGDPTPVPEPGTLLMMGLGLIALGMRRRTRA